MSPVMTRLSPAGDRQADESVGGRAPPDWPGLKWSARLPRRLLDTLLVYVLGPVAGIGLVLLLQAVHHGPSSLAPRAALHAAASAPPAPASAGSEVTAQAAPVVSGPMLPAPNFGGVHPTKAVRHMVNWVVSREDNAGAPFFVIDKHEARVYVFQPNGSLVGTASVLLGSARGDDSYPGIGQVPVLAVKPWQRTTPAGRFVTRPGQDDEHHDIVWIDYDAGVAMHRVINKVRAERRPERLASPDPRVKRISFGCVNVPIPFFESVISPVFGHRPGVAYIIPEVRSFRAVFETHDDPATILGEAPPRPATVASASALPPARLR